MKKSQEIQRKLLELAADIEESQHTRVAGNMQHIYRAGKRWSVQVSRDHRKYQKCFDSIEQAIAWRDQLLTFLGTL